MEFGEVMTHTTMLSHLAAAGQQRKCLQGGQRQKEDTSLGGQKESEDRAPPTQVGTDPAVFVSVKAPREDGQWGPSVAALSPTHTIPTQSLATNGGKEEKHTFTPAQETTTKVLKKSHLPPLYVGSSERKQDTLGSFQWRVENGI